jgi:chemotaxis signal transduction protein
MSSTLKYIIIGLIVLIGATLAVIMYRMFFQFKSELIKQYVMAEAVKYKDKESAYAIILDGVEHILSSHNLTQQVLKTAAANQSGKEQELVHAAIMQSRSLDYI